MAFKRMEGFAGSIPQKFIDNSVPKCPMCGSTEPHWAIDPKMGWINRYLFKCEKCEKCECILSASTPDVTGFSRTPLSTLGLAKALGGKKMSTIYMKIEEVGSIQTTKLHYGKEMGLAELNNMANQL